MFENRFACLYEWGDSWEVIHWVFALVKNERFVVRAREAEQRQSNKHSLPQKKYNLTKTELGNSHKAYYK